MENLTAPGKYKRTKMGFIQCWILRPKDGPQSLAPSGMRQPVTQGIRMFKANFGVFAKVVFQECKSAPSLGNPWEISLCWYMRVNPKGNQPWILTGRTDAEAEAPILWPPDLKSQLIGKDPDVAKDWRQKEKRTTEDEMVGWHHRLNGCELGQTREDGEGQGGLACCSPWGQKESDRTWWLNNNNTYEGGRMWWLWNLFLMSHLDFLLFSKCFCPWLRARPSNRVLSHELLKDPTLPCKR